VPIEEEKEEEDFHNWLTACDHNPLKQSIQFLHSLLEESKLLHLTQTYIPAMKDQKFKVLFERPSELQWLVYAHRVIED
jgi:hypothetical protein